MANATWLADVLREAGLEVEELPGWKSRGRGPMGTIKGVICHHTGSNPKGGDAPALPMIRDGRTDPPLAGPLSQLHLDRKGRWTVVAAGRCNHAGPGYWHGVSSGNTEMLGVEAENNGAGEPWPSAQTEAYARGVAAILHHIGADDVMAVGHKEWALPKGRKVDPTFNMTEFREAVEDAMAGAQAVTVPAPTNPLHSMLKKGDMGDSVRELQSLLSLQSLYHGKLDGDFGPGTDAALRLFQKKSGLEPDGKAGPKTWAALGVK